MNKRYINFLLVGMFALTIAVNIVDAQQSSLPTESYGVWNRGGDARFLPSRPEYDYLLGITEQPKWSEIQPGMNDPFEWDELQASIDLAAANGQLITIKINVGPQSPSWIYTEGGVPLAATSGHRFTEHPYYLDDNYKLHYRRMIDAFAGFVNGQDPDKRAIIAFIFPQNGATGDEVPYKGDLVENKLDEDGNVVLDEDGEIVKRYAIGDDQWANFREESWLYWRSAFPDMPFLFNELPVGEREWNFVVANIGINFGIKNSNGNARGHHLTNERSWYEDHHEFLVNPQGLALFNRAEMDQSWSEPLFQINQELGFHWAAIGGLSTGLSVWDVTTSALEEAENNESIQDSFRFFTKYAGQIDPATSTKAFIALHEGLDASDTDKFPTETYGNDNRQDTERYKMIVAAYAHRGAKIDDEVALSKGQVYQRENQTGYNDCGWEIWPTNYARFITQMKPEEESIGLFRVGIVDGAYEKTDSKYSRFARSFENSTGRNAMHFQMQDGFFSSDAGVEKFSVTFSVIYFDKNEGSTWELQYDAGGEVLKTAEVVVCEGTSEWKTLEVTVTDAVMQNNGPDGADFALVNTDMDETLTDDDDSVDDIFHMIEIEQLPGVPFVLGDVNQDGAVNLLDISPFIILLTTGTHQAEADINEDGFVNLLDVGPFIKILIGS